ncbi:acyl-CoA carboxylase subunit epsilon [Lysobacter korlensis]|uniref:Acyl-CoA carboxylase subunit epsilon n=1 Tax=Lysobacter korlensis TaxID=553636 RepID=A0ABV6RYI6_9GAMM
MPAADAEPPIDLRVVAGQPTDEELAAVTAVLHLAVREHAAAPEERAVPDGRHWQRAFGMLRSPVVPGRGAWRSF